MNKFFYAAVILMLCSCTKYSPKTNSTPTPPKRSQTTIELSSIYNNINTNTISVLDKWQVTGNLLDTVISNDSSTLVLNINNNSLKSNDGIGLGIKYFRLNNNTLYTIANSTFAIDSNKVYSFITAQKNVIPNGLKDFILKIEESDFTAPPAGFAKLRFIIAVPTVGSGEGSKQNTEMKPSVEITGPQQQTINLGAQGRYTLDVLDNPALLDFITVPAGNYIQKAVMPSMPGSNFNLISGNKYTILVTRMARTQYPENDNLKLIKHSF